MNDSLRKIVIVGGGSAGWLTAGIIAAEHRVGAGQGIEIVLIESPDIPTVGVGEGTWPSMRTTLKKMGVSETDFFRECDASFKQGSKFCGWSEGASEAYYHPFTLPEKFNQINLAEHWLRYKDRVSFADAVCPQSLMAERFLAPKQLSTPEFSAVLNYGYHLDAGKFSHFLRKHCVEKLGVEHLLDNVLAVNTTDDGDIASVTTQKNGAVSGDLFIDCTGFASVLLGKHYQIPFVEVRDVLFNDSALAVQVPYARNDDPIASCTYATAQSQGWIWDIGLPTRRGVGHVYSSAHTSDDQVEVALRHYLSSTSAGVSIDNLSIRKLTFNPGYREKFWHKNCVAIGISAGFIEPLEATALVLIELSAQMISEQLPANRAVMDILAKRFNEKFAYRWQRIIDFLKLHYVLSQRSDSAYWQDHRDPASIPASLQELLQLWRYQTPWKYDTLQVDEMFPAPSYQYVALGMGMAPQERLSGKRGAIDDIALANQLFDENRTKVHTLSAHLPSNRQLLARLQEFSFPQI